MAYYDAMIAEWKKLSGTSEEKLSQINAMTVPGPDRPVPVREISAYWRENNLWLGIKKAAADGSSIGAMATVDLNDDLRMETVRMNLPIVGQMLVEMVAKSLLSQAQADAVVAMGKTSLPWWQSAGYSSPINDSDLLAAGGLK